MIQISTHKKNLALMTVGESVAFHEFNKERLNPEIAAIALLAKPAGGYTVTVEALSKAYKRSRFAFETVPMREKENLRDGGFRTIYQTTKNKMLHSAIEEVREAAKIVMPYLENYAKLATMPYETESAAAIGLVSDLMQDGVKVHVIRLGLLEEVEAFDAASKAFQALYEQRYDKQYNQKLEGSMDQLHKQADEKFDALCTCISALQLMLDAPADLAKLDKLAVIINAALDQFTKIIHHRLGVSSASKDNDGYQKPDITNPEVPGDGGEDGGDGGDSGDEGEDGTENPNIENPPVPPFIPDFE